METVIVLDDWSSGSTAVTGCLQRLGGYTCPPHVQTFDERTPDSYESQRFRNAMAECVGELTLKRQRKPDDVVPWFTRWLAKKQDEARDLGHQVIVLKNPLTAFMIPQLVQVAQSRFVVVTRKFASIEKTRLRRKWHPTYGEAGARKVYSSIFSTLMEQGQSYHAIAYEEFLASDTARAALRAYLPAPLNTAPTTAAEAWIRR